MMVMIYQMMDALNANFSAQTVVLNANKTYVRNVTMNNISWMAKQLNVWKKTMIKIIMMLIYQS